MKALLIEETEFTPKISFDPNSRIFEVSGVSRPEDVMGFFEKPIKWLKEYELKVLAHADAKYDVEFIKLILKLTYFNSASSKSLLQILNILNNFQQKLGITIMIDFYYDAGDEQMREDGEDLSEAVGIPFEFVPVSN